jgi:hypothetical protein
MALNLEGKRFGKLLVVRRLRGGIWICQCDCGGVSFPSTSNLQTGNSKSCGCSRDLARHKHGKANTPEHRVWMSMRVRCLNPDNDAYRNYGGRGITIAPEWDDFRAFLRDMGPKPTPKHQLDRVDNSKGYSKENCRWTSRVENLNNKRTNRSLTFNGKAQTIAQWAAEAGMNYRTLNNRINRGWPVERALTEPVLKEI